MQAVVREEAGRMPTILSRMPAHGPAVRGRIFSCRRDPRRNRRVPARGGDMIIPRPRKAKLPRGWWAGKACGRRRLEKFTRVPQISLRNCATSIAA